MPATDHLKPLLHRRLLAEALVRESQNLTVVAVRTRLWRGSPNTITPLLAEWPNETKQAASMSAVSKLLEAIMRQVLGAA